MRKNIVFILLSLAFVMPFLFGCSRINNTITPSETVESTEVTPILIEETTAALNSTDHLIKWATNPNYPPYDWLNNEGQYEGAVIDLLREVIPEGYELEPVIVPWKRAQEMAKNGEIDLLVNFRVTPERSEWLEFSENPTFYNPISIFMLKENVIPFDAWDELIPLTGGVAFGDTYGNGFDEYLQENLTVESAPSMIENFKKLETGRIDYFVSGYYMGMAMLESSKLSDRIVALSAPISNNSIHLGFSKKSKFVTLLPEIDEKLAQLESDGQLEQMLAKYLKLFSDIPIEEFPVSN